MNGRQIPKLDVKQDLLNDLAQNSSYDEEVFR